MSQKTAFERRLDSFQNVVEAERVFEARSLVQKNREILVVVVRQQPHNVVFQCPCGCGDILVINVNSQSGPSWGLRRKGNLLTLMPSVWRDQGCESHFILWENHVWWCGSREERLDLAWPEMLRLTIRAWWKRLRRKNHR